MIALFRINIFRVLLLGFVSGLPFALTTSTLNIWLTEVGIPISKIGLFSAISIPYSLKFLWAAFIDNFDIPYLSRKYGRRISWIISSQIALIISIISLGNTDPTENLVLTATCAFIVVICSATQDISIDSYRIKILNIEEQGVGAAAANYGYRLGMLFTSAGALILSGYFEWNIVYLIAALGVTIGFSIAVNNNFEKDSIKSIKKDTKHKLTFKKFIDEMIILPWTEFAQKNDWLIIIFFTIFFRLSDSMADVLSNSFYIDMGFSKSEIATIVKTFGLIAMLIGSFLGGFMVYKIGLIHSLWICGIFQMLSNIGFLILSDIGYDIDTLTIIVAIENLASGAGSTAFVAYLSSLCSSSSFTASHYALLSAFASVGRNILSIPAGYIVEYFDWSGFYSFTIMAALPGLIFLYIISTKS